MELDRWEYFNNGDSIIVVNTVIDEAAYINVFVANKKDITKDKSIHDVMIQLHEEIHEETNKQGELSQAIRTVKTAVHNSKLSDYDKKSLVFDLVWLENHLLEQEKTPSK